MEKRPFPAATVGAAVGLAIAVAVAIARDDDRSDDAEATTAKVREADAGVAATAPPAPLTASTSTSSAAAPLPTRASAQRADDDRAALTDPLLPPAASGGGTNGSSASRSRDVHVAEPLDEVTRWYLAPERDWGGCASPSSLSVPGAARVLHCTGPGAVARVVVLRPGRDGGTSVTSSVITRHHSRGGAAAAHPCGYALRYLALPPGVRVGASGGTATTTDCSMSAPSDAQTASRAIADAALSPTAVRDHVSTQDSHGVQELVIGGDSDGTVWVIAAWSPTLDDAARAQGAPTDATVFVARFGSDATRWFPPIIDTQKAEELRRCTLPCAAALGPPPRRDDFDAARSWDGDAERCLFACAGEPGAPHRVTPIR